MPSNVFARFPECNPPLPPVRFRWPEIWTNTAFTSKVRYMPIPKKTRAPNATASLLGSSKRCEFPCGVAGDVRHVGLDAGPDMQVYIPHQQWPFPDGLMVFVIRVASTPVAISSAAQRAIHSLDATQPISRIMPLESYVGLSVQGRRFALILI